jgi:hypothetical protein
MEQMNDNKFNQRRKILQYCEEHGSITIRDAFEKLFINSPSKRISEMRLSGYNVDFVVEKRTNAAGKEVRYKRYFISEPVRGEAR